MTLGSLARMSVWLRTTVTCGVFVGVCLVAASVRADERFFTYSYEPKVLPKGALELEQWATMRNGREEGLYTRWDLRQEFEVGLTDRLTTAIYMNAANVYTLSPEGESSKGLYFRGWSSEWKYKLTDPAADALGVLLYGEFALDRREWEAEGKLVLGKNIGNVVLAANGIYELEGKAKATEGEIETEFEHIVSGTAGVSYRLGNVALGAEARTHTEIVKGEAEHTAFFGGPVLHTHGERWWATLTLLKQFTDHLDEHEKTETRLLFGIQL